MLITLGWWIVPALITAAAFLWARREDRAAFRNASGYSRIGAAAVGIIAYLAAAVVALVAWLIWSIAG